MFKKISGPTLFILIALSFMLSGFSGCGPIISKQPADTTVAVGGVAYFTVGAIGLNFMNYQWEKMDTAPGSEWTAISGATYSTLTIPAVALEDDEAKFRCLVTNVLGQSVSREAVLTVAKRIYVNCAATGGDNGTSWANAYTDLQDALARATEGFEIWVAVGFYKPTADSDRNKSFELKEGISLYGGFIGMETDLTQRDWKQNETVLSGDIGIQDDISDNTFHIIIGIGGSLLDGFTVTKGNASGDTGFGDIGAGIRTPSYSVGSLPPNDKAVTINNCIIRDNNASSAGGLWASMATVVNVNNSEFINNIGGDLYCRGRFPSIYACTFTGYIEIYGGVSFINCEFNESDIFILWGPVKMLYCLLNNTTLGNHIDDGDGSGAFQIINCIVKDSHISNWDSDPYIINGTFLNSLLHTGSLSRPRLYNCIFTEGSTISVSGSSWAHFYNCNIQGSGGSGSSWFDSRVIDMGGNIDADPMFADSANGDYRLLPGSPCINVGLNSIIDIDMDGNPDILADMDGNPRIIGDIVDMGAYEYQGD
jgi:autotransporter family porin